MKSVACLPHDKNRKICISGGKLALNVVFLVERASNVSVQATEGDLFRSVPHNPGEKIVQNVKRRERVRYS